jgi:hypothetical protein
MSAWTRIAHTELGSASAIELTSIPGTYTDLILLFSIRGASSGFFGMQFNGSGSNFSSRFLYGNGAATASETRTDGYISYGSGPSETASTFANYQLYIPNYAGSTNKSWSIDGVGENNATTAHQTIMAGLWSQTAAITSITLNNWTTTNLAQYSSATLYGITKGSSGGVTVS